MKDDTRVETTVEFLALPNAIDCDKIDWIQSLRLVDSESGQPMMDDFKERTSARGSAIDQVKPALKPFYTDPNEEWMASDTPRETYGVAGTGGAEPKAAFMRDAPGIGNGNETWSFESCAVCRTTSTPTEVYGCAEWQFTTDEDAVVSNISKPAIAAAPSAEFDEARKAWNEWAKKNPKGGKRQQIPELHEVIPKEPKR